VVVVADDMIEIVSELSRLVERYDVVLTSGGLGPTHDDITIKAVARALGVSLTRSEELAKTILDRYDDSGQVIAPALLEKMSTLPDGATLRFPANDPEAWPILQCANVFVLPGVPAFFTSKLEAITSDFLAPAHPPLLSRRVRLSRPEEAIVEALNTCVADFPDVAFGSYPVSQGETRTIVTLEAAAGSAQTLKAGLAALLAALPDGALVDVSDSACLSPAEGPVAEAASA